MLHLYVFTPVCDSVHRGVWQTPPGRQPPPTGQTPPPLGRHSLGRHPPSRRQLQRSVRILLECILVVSCLHMVEIGKFNDVWKHTAVQLFVHFLWIFIVLLLFYKAHSHSAIATVIYFSQLMRFSVVVAITPVNTYIESHKTHLLRLKKSHNVNSPVVTTRLKQCNIILSNVQPKLSTRSIRVDGLLLNGLSAALSQFAGMKLCGFLFQCRVTVSLINWAKELHWWLRRILINIEEPTRIIRLKQTFNQKDHSLQSYQNTDLSNESI